MQVVILWEKSPKLCSLCQKLCVKASTTDKSASLYSAGGLGHQAPSAYIDFAHIYNLVLEILKQITVG